MKNKKITFILADLRGGGTEKVVVTYAIYFYNLGYKVEIITLFQGSDFFELPINIKVYRPNITREKYHRFIYAFLLIPYIRKTIKISNPDTIVSNGEWFNPYVVLATRFLNVKLFLADHMNPNLKFGILLDNAKRLLYKKANGIIALSEYAAEILHKKTGSKRIKAIPNPLIPIEWDNFQKRNSIVSLGRLSKEKGHEFLIKAFALINNNNWNLEIIGDGPERKKLEVLCKELNISKNVIFHGHIREFSSILASSRIFVLPSLSENFPIALIEAMSVPLPCISSDVMSAKGADVIIENNINGILVPAGNPAILAEKIIDLMQDSEKCAFLSTNAYKIREKLDIEKIGNEYLNFIFEGQ